MSQLALARLLQRQFDLLTRLTWPQAHLEKHETLKAKNCNKSRIRSRVEHVFGVVKRLRRLCRIVPCVQMHSMRCCW